MQSEQDALLRGICIDPYDDVARLVYADWLEEHGRAEHAEFIRVQIALAGVLSWETSSPEAVRLRARQFHLFGFTDVAQQRAKMPNPKNWAWGLPTTFGVYYLHDSGSFQVEFLRGFPAAFHCTTPIIWEQIGPRLIQHYHPIEIVVQRNDMPSGDFYSSNRDRVNECRTAAGLPPLARRPRRLARLTPTQLHTKELGEYR